jgi:hypothetical protein
LAAELPLVGVPDPTAIAKMCIALTPFPIPLLIVGSVTDFTVLPDSSGTDAQPGAPGCLTAENEQSRTACCAKSDQNRSRSSSLLATWDLSLCDVPSRADS